MGDRLIKTDKNGTQYFVSTVCPRCGGTGHLNCFEHVEYGVCFKCGGSGVYETHYKVHTPEYEQKLTERRLAKARKTADERNHKTMISEGFSEDGKVWIVMGNTYEIKDALKAAGAKWNPTLGWHFDHENDFDCVVVTYEELTRESADGTRYYDEAYDKIQNLRDEYHTAHCTSEYVGNIGDKITTDLKFVNYAVYESFYGTCYVLVFEDDNHNKIVWKTGSGDAMNSMINHIGETFKVKATIKDHSEYRGEKQTYLSRAKIA